MGQKPTVVHDGVDFSKYKTIAAKEVEVDNDATQGIENDKDTLTSNVPEDNFNA